MASASSTPPPPSHEVICTLLSHSKYNPAIIPQLQAYANSEAQALISGDPSLAPYDFNANRTLVKLYQFFPHLENEDCTALILLLSLLEFPSTDFMALCCLVPDKVQSKCSTLVRCAELLEGCQFEEFWSVFCQIGTDQEVTSDASSSLLSSVANSPTVISKVQLSILELLSMTYLDCPLSVVLPSLGFKDVSSLKDFVKTIPTDSNIVSSVGDDAENGVVSFIANLENSNKQSRVSKDGGVKVDAIAAMMMKGFARQ